MRKTVIWTLLFLGILLLTQGNNFLPFDKTPGWLGLPTWLWYFISVHLLFVIALYFFGRSITQSDNS